MSNMYYKIGSKGKYLAMITIIWHNELFEKCMIDNGIFVQKKFVNNV
jgi:hypothetical protein